MEEIEKESEKAKLEENLQLFESIKISREDIKNGNLISQEEIKRRLGYKDKKCKENA